MKPEPAKKPGSVWAAIALGSNLGDRKLHLERAVREIEALDGVRVLCVSQWVETEPVDVPAPQGRYLNGALTVETQLSARALLEALQRIERAHGRERSGAPVHAARTLDLDLLLYDDARIDEPGLSVPHPRMEERAFVLVPLAQIAPDAVLARSRVSVAQRARELCERAGAPVREHGRG